MLKIVASLTDDSRGIFYYHSIFYNIGHRNYPHKARLGTPPETNTIAYLSSLSVMKKSFTRLTPGPNVIKLFTAVIYKYS